MLLLLLLLRGGDVLRDSRSPFGRSAMVRADGLEEDGRCRHQLEGGHQLGPAAAAGARRGFLIALVRFVLPLLIAFLAHGFGLM